MKKRIALGADHRGFKLKENLKQSLNQWGVPFTDFGTNSIVSTDYPKIGLKVALAVRERKCFGGILICASGIGFSIVANKVKGIRAALCHDLKAARLSRRHNDANILVINGTIPKKSAEKMIKIWLKTEFEGGRHRRRVNQIKAFEEKYLK